MTIGGGAITVVRWLITRVVVLLLGRLIIRGAARPPARPPDRAARTIEDNCVKSDAEDGPSAPSMAKAASVQDITLARRYAAATVDAANAFLPLLLLDIMGSDVVVGRVWVAAE